MKTEPVLTVASVQAVLAALLTVLVAFDVWNPTPDQRAAVFGLYAVAAPLLFGLWARAKVAPVVVDEATHDA